MVETKSGMDKVLEKSKTKRKWLDQIKKKSHQNNKYKEHGILLGVFGPNDDGM